jgi:putative ABC transport system permease protein
MKLEYLKLALGNLSQRKTRSILTMIGIFIGIAAVISLISLGQGLKTAVSAQFSALGSDRLVIQAKGAQFGPPGQNTAALLTTDDLRTVQRGQYVRIAAGRILKPAVVEYNDEEQVLFVASIPDENEEERAVVLEITKPKILDGRMLDTSDRYKAVIGYNWGQENSFDKEVQVGDKMIVHNKTVEVVGILDRTGNPIWDNVVFLNEEPMRNIFNLPDEYSVITAKVDSEEVLGLAIDQVTRDLRRDRHVKIRQEDFTVQSSTQLVQSIFDILNVIQAVLIGIAAISLIVGGIGIMNTMYTSVLERTREIGIMKSIGATRQIILIIFLIEAATLGIIGGAVGIALGIGLAKAVEFAASQALGPGLLIADISIWVVLGALAFSMIVGIISGVMPALQASKMEPVEALNA